MVMLAGTGLPCRVSAQVPLPIPFPPPLPKLPEQLPPPAPPPLILPPLPPAPPRRELAPPLKFFLHDIQLVGNTIFTDEQLEEVTRPYKAREVIAEELEALRFALTAYYVNRGYVTSGAIIPDQAVTFGVLTLQIIEGRLSRIDLDGNRILWNHYLLSRIEPGVTIPLNANALQERLQFLQRDSHVERVNAELKPGDALGESVLNVQVQEAPIFHGRIDINNFQSPTVGSVQGLGTIEDTNLIGLGDTLSVTYGRSSGVNPILNARYAIPINHSDTTLSAQYRRFGFAVQQAPFNDLEIKNTADIVSVGIRHPVYRTLDREFALGITAEYEKNTSTLLGEPFDFVPGTQDGVFYIAPIRFIQEYVQQSSEQVFSAFSRFTYGTGALDATNANTKLPQSATARFFSWLGEAQYVRQLPFLRTEFLGHTTLQVTNQHLFPLEQIAVGGRYSVRGYREYTLVVDNAFLASMDFRVPVFTTSDGVDRLHIVPFADVGRAWNTSFPTPTPNLLASVGVGLIWTITPQSRFEIYKGFQLNHLNQGTGDLQDYGIHFQLVLQLFDL